MSLACFDGTYDNKCQVTYRQGDEQDDTDPYKAKYTTDNTVNQAGNNPIHHDFSIGIDVFGAIFFSQPQY